MFPTCHDDLIVGFSVDCEQRFIKLLGKQPAWRNDPRSWQMSFEDVVAYRLTNDAFGNILYDVRKISHSDFYSEYGSELRGSFVRHGAAGPWIEDKDSALLFLESHKIAAYQITSTLGLDGWILSTSAKFDFT